MAGTPWKDTTAWFHSRQKEPAERAFSRLRVRLGKGGGGGVDFSRGRVCPGFAGGFWEWKGCEKRENGGPFFFFKKNKACEMCRGEGLESQRQDTYVLPDF